MKPPARILVPIPLHLDVEREVRELADPARRPGKVRTLADMSPEEIERLERDLGAKVKR